jgi:hypothetical protein
VPFAVLYSENCNHEWHTLLPVVAQSRLILSPGPSHGSDEAVAAQQLTAIGPTASSPSASIGAGKHTVQGRKPKILARQALALVGPVASFRDRDHDPDLRTAVVPAQLPRIFSSYGRSAARSAGSSTTLVPDRNCESDLTATRSSSSALPMQPLASELRMSGESVRQRVGGDRR